MWSGLFRALDLAVPKARSCHLLWTHRDPPREEELPINHSHCHNFSCLLESSWHMDTQHTGARSRGAAGWEQSSLKAAPRCPAHSLSCSPPQWRAPPHPLCPLPSAQLLPDPQRHSGTRTRAPVLPRVLGCGMLLCWEKRGGNPAATRRSGRLQTMAAWIPHVSLSKEPCFWIIYTTFRQKYFVFYSVDAFFLI